MRASAAAAVREQAARVRHVLGVRDAIIVLGFGRERARRGQHGTFGRDALGLGLFLAETLLGDFVGLALGDGQRRGPTGPPCRGAVG